MAAEKTGPDQDPIVDSSLSWPLAITSVLLALSTVWAFYQETVGIRPWKGYQSRFVDVYGSYLDRLQPTTVDDLSRIQKSQSYEGLTADIKATEAEIAPRLEEIDGTLNKEINPRIAAISVALQKSRGHVNALIYQIEIAPESRKETLRADLEAYKKGPFMVEVREGDTTKEVPFDFDTLIREFDELKNRRGRLIQQRAEVSRPADALRKRRTDLVSNRLTGLAPLQIEGLKAKLVGFETEIKQIHVADVDLVDRCESCHLGIREPLTLTAADMGNERVFMSHPRPDLLKIHNPEEFGCSPCHGGNGVATTSVKKAHGKYKHWLWPLHDVENTESGCLQCHEGSLHLDGAPVLNHGIELFQRLGCWACHRREGFNNETVELQSLSQKLSSLARQEVELEKKVRAAETITLDRDATNEDVDQALKRINSLTLQSSAIETERSGVRQRTRSLLRQRKRPGPNLKEIRAKLRPEWLPEWIASPHAFRPDTKMPEFRLDTGQVQAISAFLWQSALDIPAPPQSQGNPEKGQALFEGRGCLACHSLGTGEETMGGDFAANLSRVGEKVNYDYLVRWIHNPRQRLAPYSPTLGRDLTSADYARSGLPFQFDDDDATCPISGDAIVNQNMTVMPSLRLTWEEARDIASYLMTMRQDDDPSSRPAFLEDRALRPLGEKYVRHFGCYSCHEIAGLENEGAIGTELTAEGSKPIERLDFGHLTHEAKGEDWYNHKGFFERKIGLHVDDPADPRNTTHRPNYFDLHKERGEFEVLRMPDFYLDEEQNRALVTFLLGSVDSQYPPRFYYRPEGDARAVVEGWEVIKKYNCMGCHQILDDELPAIQDLPWYAGEYKVKAPPNLVGQGFRTDPDWLAGFLSNPSLTEVEESSHRNGVRPYLEVRMPTFYLSEEEVAKLVRFFAGRSSQPFPYLPPAVEPLSRDELLMARDAFTSSDCLKCHAGGDPSSFSADTIAPNFVLTKERLKSGWVERWLLDPARLMPGTQMPTGLFDYQADKGRWVIKGVIPDSMKNYAGDHVDLFVRYMWQFDEAEGKLLGQK